MERHNTDGEDNDGDCIYLFGHRQVVFERGDDCEDDGHRTQEEHPTQNVDVYIHKTGEVINYYFPSLFHMEKENI